MAFEWGKVDRGLEVPFEVREVARDRHGNPIAFEVPFGRPDLARPVPQRPKDPPIDLWRVWGAVVLLAWVALVSVLLVSSWFGPGPAEGIPATPPAPSPYAGVPDAGVRPTTG